MSTVHINETNIQQVDDGVIELWRVRGLSGWWPTKIVAEAAARAGFPDEDPDKRYGRISFERVYLEDGDA